MLTPELQKKIDEKWNACWPLSTLRPIAILDLISYLFFYKKISEHILISINSEKTSNPLSVIPKEKELIAWSTFETLDEQNMHAVFSCENGIIDLVKKYYRNSAYELFLKGNLLLVPTPKLLFNATGIIKLIEESDEDTKGSISEYLLNKADVNGQNGQAYLPEYLVEIMISIIEPDQKDWMLDPSAGNASLLVNSIKYISKRNTDFSKNLISNFDSGRFLGIESDPTNLRIAGMNMILHGVHNPELKLLNNSSLISSVTTEQTTAFVANLVFSAIENKTGADGTLVRDTTRREIFHLNFILKNSKPGTRAVIIIPDVILYNMGAEIIAVRQEMVDNFKLEGIISVSDRTEARFLGTSILIFSKEIAAITDKVWFYKMESKKSNKGNASIENDHSNNTIIASDQTDETKKIIQQFRSSGSKRENKNPEFFYIDAADIRSRNYNLSYNEYILFLNQEIKEPMLETNSVEKRIAINQVKNQPLFPAAEKIILPKKSNAKKIIVISILSIIIIGSGFLSYWVFYLKKDFPFIEKHAVIATKTKDSTISSPKKNTKNTIQLPDSSNITSTKYVVVNRAYFYSTPDSNSRRDIYINQYSNTILTPTDQKNGFVYVVYVNKHGESTKGWINKKDLRPSE